jgi:hypothetical protein
MLDATLPPGREPTNFILPEAANFSLVQLSIYARMMARITAPGSDASLPHPDIRADALSLSYAHIAQDVDAVLDQVFYSEAAANALREAGIERKDKKRDKRQKR